MILSNLQFINKEDERKFELKFATTVCTVTIIDDDKPGKFSFTQPNYAATEADNFVNVKVIRTEGGDGTITIDYQTLDGNAFQGIDY